MGLGRNSSEAETVLLDELYNDIFCVDMFLLNAQIKKVKALQVSTAHSTCRFNVDESQVISVVLR